MFATVNGIRVAYEEAGDGEALVFVHGLGGTLHVWYPVSQQLASDWKTIAYDVRGHGRTDKPAPPYTIDLWADDLIALLDAARIERATVFGHSSGSLVAQRFAERESGRANGLVLLGAISRFDDKGRAAFEARAQAVESGGIEAFVDQFVKGAFHPSTHEEHPEIGGPHARCRPAKRPWLLCGSRARPDQRARHQPFGDSMPNARAGRRSR